LSSSSRKFCPLSSNAWKDIFQMLIMMSYSFFLLKSYDDLQRWIRVRSNFFVSLSTMLRRDYFWLLEQFQNLMRLLLSFLKNPLSLQKIDVKCIWYKCNDKSKIFLVVCIESVMMKIWLTLGKQIAWLILHLITKSLALVDVMLTTWYIVLMIGLLWIWMWQSDS